MFQLIKRLLEGISFAFERVGWKGRDLILPFVNLLMLSAIVKWLVAAILAFRVYVTEQKVIEVFKEYFMNSFSSRLAEYSNPIIEVNSKEKINENYTIVSSTLVATAKRPEIKIEWRIYTKNPETPLIRDLIIEGLSLARTQKEEFNSIIQSADGDIGALLNNLRNFSKK